MRVNWSFSQSSKLATLVLNEGYFRFNSSVLLRVDCQGDNNLSILSKQQETFFEKLCSLDEGGVPIFKKVIFYENKMQILLLTQWSEENIFVVEAMIKQSWPEFFVKSYPKG